jgi:catechol 2,3-dioxygenase-like lactoylglutathione lyase family enzyme
MEVKELGHVVLYVRDLERSRRFYRDVLGWNLIVVDVRTPRRAFTFVSRNDEDDSQVSVVGVDGGRLVGR